MKKYVELYKEFENNMSEKIKSFVKEYKQVFLITLFIGVLIHLFVLSNKLLNWDEISCLFTKGGSYKLGRWLLSSTKYIFPNMSMPAFNGIISLILVSLSTVFIVDILEIKSKVNRILVGGIFISFPALTCTLTYMFTSHSYMLALFMAVLSVYFAKKEKNKISVMLSIVLLVLSLGIYQAYISITATLLIILLIKKCFAEEDIKKLIIQSIKYLSILIISLVLYAIINKIVIKLLGISLSTYQGVSNMGTYSISGIIKGIAKAYDHILSPFWSLSAITPFLIARIIYITCVLLDMICILIKILKNKKYTFNCILAIFFILLLPVTMNMMYILNENVSNHCLMMFGDCFVYIALVLMIDINKIYLNRIIKVFLIIQIFFYAAVANEAYLKMHIAYQNTYAFYEGVITSIQNTEGYDENTKIAIIGKYSSKELNRIEKFDNIAGLTGVAFSNQLMNSYSRMDFIKYYIGFNGNFINQDAAKEYLQDNEEYKNMPNYPYYGSVKKIDDIIVVKLSE